jgi:hypothetical protein
MLHSTVRGHSKKVVELAAVGSPTGKIVAKTVAKRTATASALTAAQSATAAQATA